MNTKLALILTSILIIASLLMVSAVITDRLKLTYRIPIQIDVIIDPTINVSIADLKLPDLIETNFKRIEMTDKITGYSFTANNDYVVLSMSHPKPHLDCYMIGFGVNGLVPYFDIIMELAYDRSCNNLNVVIVDKGDNGIRVYVDGFFVGETETVSQENVNWSNEEGYFYKKWVSFNFKDLKY